MSFQRGSSPEGRGNKVQGKAVSQAAGGENISLCSLSNPEASMLGSEPLDGFRRVESWGGVMLRACVSLVRTENE